jgi:hypothetical protein
MTKTPPPQTPPLSLQSTPVHTGSRTTDRFGSKYVNRARTLSQLSTEMAPFFVGPMPPEEFLDTFLPHSKQPSCDAPERPPVPPFKKEMFSALLGSSSEGEMYKTFVCFTSFLLLEINPTFLG